eukprot:UN20977
MLKTIQIAVDKAFPEDKISVQLFGSSATPLCHDSSDLDVGLNIPELNRETIRNKDYAITLLKKVQEFLSESQNIYKTRIPIIRLKKGSIKTEICLFDHYNAKKADYITHICSDKYSKSVGPFYIT